MLTNIRFESKEQLVARPQGQSWEAREPQLTAFFI